VNENTNFEVLQSLFNTKSIYEINTKNLTEEIIFSDEVINSNDFVNNVYNFINTSRE